MTRNALLGFALATAAAACARSATVESGGDVSPVSTVVPVSASSLPAGAMVRVRLDQTIGTNTSHVGDAFVATVDSTVRAENGAIVVPYGAKVYGTVTGLQSSSDPTKPAVIRLDFDRLSFGGTNYPFEASVAATNVVRQGETRNETLKKAGIGAAAGAVLGAVLSDADLKSILIGGALGAAAGTAISLGTGDVEAALPAGTDMTLRVTSTVALR